MLLARSQGREGHAPSQYTHGFVFIHAVITVDRAVELVCTCSVCDLCRTVFTWRIACFLTLVYVHGFPLPELVSILVVHGLLEGLELEIRGGIISAGLAVMHSIPPLGRDGATTVCRCPPAHTLISSVHS